ncbi:MAG TPA: TonB-dependent receptor [Hyphomicrobium sp.]|nr:TonB-dependent receptor [Hyphomicrobium sp.]
MVEGATLAAPPATPTKKPAPVSNTPGETEAAAQPTALQSGEASASSDVSGVLADQIGTAVTVITRKDLENRQVRYAADALRDLPGVEVSQSGGVGNLTQVRIRGAEANQTLVLIDGIEANNPTDGEFDFSNLATADIERIEVIRGPMSGVYGSSAVGGVINIITRGGRGPLTFTARAEGGSFDTDGTTVGVSAGNDKGSFAISYDRRKTDGFNIAPVGTEKDGSMLSTFSARGRFSVLDNVSINFALRNMLKEGDRDNFTGPIGSLATAVDDYSTFTADTWLGGINLRWDTLGGHLTHEVHVNRSSDITTDTDRSVPAFPFFSQNDSTDIKYGYLTTLRFGTPELLAAQHTVSGLIERERETFTPEGDLGDFIERSRERLSYVAEYRGGFSDTVFVTANVRRDNNEQFQDFTTWRTAVSIPLKGLGLRPHASVGTSVKFPSMFELYGTFPAFFIPNPDLKPEQSFGWDAGVEYTFAKKLFTVDVTYFDADLKNEIDVEGFPQQPFNEVGKSTREGIEVAARTDLGAGLSVGAAYTYLDAKKPDDSEAIRRPPHTGRVDVNYAFLNKGNVNFAVAYTGQQDDFAFRELAPFGTAQERVTLDSYWLATIAASYEIANGVQVFGRVENAFNAHYQDVYGFDTAPIAAFAGVRLTYEEAQSIAWANGK